MEPPQSHSLDALFTRYLAHHAALNRSPRSIDHHRDSQKLLLRFLAETDRAADHTVLTTETMQGFATWLRDSPSRGWRGRTQRSVHANHGTLKDMQAFTRWLLAEQLIETAVKVPIPRLPQTLFPVLTDEEITAIWNSQHLTFPGSLGKRNRALLALMFDTGVRASEVVNLRLQDVDLDNQLITVTGKGDKQRRVPFSHGVALYLAEWLKERGDDPRPVFLLKQAGLRMLFDRIKQDTGIPVFHPHGVRHTAATQMVRANMDLHSVKRVLGHAHLSTTERYLSLSDADLREKHAAASPFERIRTTLQPPSPAQPKRLRRT
jgi:site-specific recombinase XerD